MAYRQALVLALVAACAGACGQASADTGAGAGAPPPVDPATAALIASKTQKPVWTPAPARPGEKVHPGLGLRTRPAPADLRTIVSAEQARAAADGQAIGARGAPDVALRLVTTGDFGPGPGVPHALKDHPAWVLTYADTVPAHGGPPRARPIDAARARCESTVVVDAATAALIANVQDCHPR